MKKKLAAEKLKAKNEILVVIILFILSFSFFGYEFSYAIYSQSLDDNLTLTVGDKETLKVLEDALGEDDSAVLEIKTLLRLRKI